MGRSTKHIYPMLCLIVVLAGVLAVFHFNPSILQSLPWLSPDEPPIIEQPDNPPDDNQNPPEQQPPVDEPPVDNPPEKNPPDDDPPVENPPVVDPPIDDPTDQPTVPQSIVTLTGYYYTYANMKSDLAELAERYPNTMSYRSYGISADGRDLYAATLGNPNAPKQVIITSGMHAREYVNSFVVMRQLEYYLENYDTVRYEGHLLRDLFEEVCFVIVPMTNPDGITLAQEGIDAIRNPALQQIIRGICGSTNTKVINDYLNMYWKSNARGVDINRNFDALWDEHNDIVGRPAAKNYKGTSAMSEVESAYLVALTESLSNPVASVCVHSQGEIIYWRCFQEGTLEIENKRLAQIAQKVTGYAIIDDNQTEPSYSNWTILAHGIPTITVETGLGGYPQNHGTMASGIYDRNRDLWAAVAAAYAGLAKG